MSLTISGWVGEQVLWWDDGAARGTYVGGLGTTLASRVILHRSGNHDARVVMRVMWLGPWKLMRDDPLIAPGTGHLERRQSS